MISSAGERRGRPLAQRLEPLLHARVPPHVVDRRPAEAERIEKYEYIRAIGSRSASTRRICGLAAWKKETVRFDITM